MHLDFCHTECFCPEGGTIFLTEQRWCRRQAHTRLLVGGGGWGGGILRRSACWATAVRHQNLKVLSH